MIKNSPDEFGKTYAFGLTYLEHLKEIGEKISDPVIFEKCCHPNLETSLVQTPTHDDIMRSLVLLDTEVANKLKNTFSLMPALLDYEVELGMVLLEEVTAEKLQDKDWMPEYGLLLANDVSARALQFAGQMSHQRLDFWSAAKSFKTFTPVSKTMYLSKQADKFPNWTLQLQVNGESRQGASLQEVILSPRQFVERALEYSAGNILFSGDLILTGTPSGIAASIPKFKRIIGDLIPAQLAVSLAIKGAQKSKKYLKAGDRVTSQIQGSDIADLDFSIE